MGLRTEQIQKDLRKMKSNGWDQSLVKFHRRIPKMVCPGCGYCCYDPPSTMYSEFLVILDYMWSNLKREDILYIYQASVKRFFLGSIEEVRCPLYDEERKMCRVYPVAPLACRGFCFDPNHEESVMRDHEENRRMNVVYEKHGVSIPAALGERRTDCDRSVIVENPYNMLFPEDLDKYIMKDLVRMERSFVKDGYRPININIGSFFAFMLMEEISLEGKISVLKAYQTGDSSLLIDAVNSVNYDQYLAIENR